MIGGVAGYYVLGDAAGVAALDRRASRASCSAVVVYRASRRYGTALLKQFMLDSRVELRKIVWPNRQETLQTTLVVFVFRARRRLFFWVPRPRARLGDASC